MHSLFKSTKQVRSMIARLYKRTEDLLKSHEGLLRELAELLLNKVQRTLYVRLSSFYIPLLLRFSLPCTMEYSYYFPISAWYCSRSLLFAICAFCDSFFPDTGSDIRGSSRKSAWSASLCGSTRQSNRILRTFA